MRNNQEYTTLEKVRMHESTAHVFQALFSEIKELSRKKPEATLSSKKVELINRVLGDVKIILENEDDHKYLDLLDDEQLPQYSDVVLVMSQYGAALSKFKTRYYGYDGVHQRWFVREE